MWPNKWNLRLYNNRDPLISLIPQAALDAYKSPLGSYRLTGHPVLYPTPPSVNSSSIPDALPPAAFSLDDPLCNAYLSSFNGFGHPLPEPSDLTSPGSSTTHSTDTAQSTTTSIPQTLTSPGPVFDTDGIFFDRQPLQDHPTLLDPEKPPADSLLVGQSESLGMESSSATNPQGKASSADLEVQIKLEPSETNVLTLDESFKEKPPHHRSAKASRTSEQWEHIQNIRRSKAPKHSRPHRPKRETERRVPKFLRRAQVKIDLEECQSLITEWHRERLNPKKSEFPVYEVISPTCDKEQQGLSKWRCSFLDDKGQCDTKWKREADARRHTLTHYPVRWLCPNPSCRKAISREDAVKRHHEKFPICQSHLPARANWDSETDTTTTVPVFSLGAEGPRLVQIKWVAASH